MKYESFHFRRRYAQKQPGTNQQVELLPFLQRDQPVCCLLNLIMRPLITGTTVGLQETIVNARSQEVVANYGILPCPFKYCRVKAWPKASAQLQTQLHFPGKTTHMLCHVLDDIFGHLFEFNLLEIKHPSTGLNAVPD
eukprot:scaffold9269_cov149-Skeletonema_marinoi.AAC.1